MDWRSVTFDWNRARAFLVTAEEGSLSAAARALGMTQPTLGRQVAALEKELGVALFERLGRGLTLTPSGLELVDHVRAMGEAASHLSLAASGQSQSIEGMVRITATEAASTFVLPRLIADLRQLEPGIEVEIVATNDVSDLRRREADIALRAARPTDPELIARKLGDETVHLYASHDYLERAGPFETPEALSRADFIGVGGTEAMIAALNALGLTVTDRNFTVRSANHIVHWEMARAGLGIGVMLTAVGDADPKVRRVADWVPPFPLIPVWLVAHRELATSRRVRFVFDWLSEALGSLIRR